MTLELGKVTRLNRLKNSGAFYFLLAADHRLNNGFISELANIRDVLSFVNRHDELSGVVLNVGSLQHLPKDYIKEVIPQLMARPVGDSNSIEKVQVGTVTEAVRAGANAISLQINFEESSYLRQVVTFSALRSEASSLGMPVLTMINLKDRAQFLTDRFLDYVTSASELGSDIIKVNLPADAEANVALIQDTLEHAPPVLLSGDALSDSYLASVRLSRRCGFSGLCVGRNIFKSADPIGRVRASWSSFQTGS